MGPGNADSLGHMDVFINGAGATQPACLGAPPPISIACGHTFAMNLFIDSFRCRYYAFRCEDDRAFRNGTCALSATARVGMDAVKPRQRGRYFLLTQAERPYCVGVDEQRRRIRARVRACSGYLGCPLTTDSLVYDGVVAPVLRLGRLASAGNLRSIVGLGRQLVGSLVGSVGAGVGRVVG